jgi:hypothetical protein
MTAERKPANTKASIDALLKEVYSDEGLQALVPSFGILYGRIPFKSAKKLGREFVHPVQVTREAGFTYGAGLQTLNGAVAADTVDAIVKGSPFTLESAWSYDAADAMASSKEAFTEGTSYRMESMTEAAIYRAELQMLRGSYALGITDSEQDSVAAVTNTVDAILPITALSWSPATFAGAENAWLSFHTTAANVASAALGDDASHTVNKFQLISVDLVAKTITVRTKDGSEAAALVAEIEAATYFVRFYGSYGNEMTGLRSVCSNTGTLYGVSGASYSMFKGNTYAVSAALSLKKIYQALAQSAGRGLLEDVTCVVSPATFAILANDEAALRQFVTSVKKSDRGINSIEFVGPTGNVEILSHPMQIESEAMIFPMKRASKIGASDITLKRPGGSDEMVYELASQTGIGTRLWADFGLFLPAPAYCSLLTGISNA